jgi:cytochrome P450
MKVMLEVLTERLPDLRLVDHQDMRVVPNLVFRNLEQLLVEPAPAVVASDSGR